MASIRYTAALTHTHIHSLASSSFSHFSSNGFKRNENKHNKCVYASYALSNLCVRLIVKKKKKKKERLLICKSTDCFVALQALSKQINIPIQSKTEKKTFEEKERNENEKNCDFFSLFRFHIDGFVYVFFLHACV